MYVIIVIYVLIMLCAGFLQQNNNIKTMLIKFIISSIRILFIYFYFKCPNHWA